MYVVLVYDISKDENGQKRWSHIFKICKKYLSHIQNSVFEGEISKVQLAKLQQELKVYIDSDWIKNFGERKMIKQALFYETVDVRQSKNEVY